MTSAYARRLSFVTPAILGLFLSACGGEPEDAVDPAGDVLNVDCPGKCDGWSSIRSLLRDARELDLGDLLSVGAGYASDELNDALAVSPYAAIAFDAPKLYATAARAESDLTLGNIDKLVSGLAYRFGERELTTEVNALRRDHLYASGDEVFAECAFKISADLHPRWDLPTGGFAGSATLGFDAGADLSARVIGAYPSELGATGAAPLAALRATRGFVLPRSLADIRKMTPGELIALQGAGGIGLNLGVGVPILIAEPASAVTYNIVLSAGLRTQLRGQMDVQLIRMGGDEVVIDVGIDSATVRSAHLAVRDGWGAQGLLTAHVEILGATVDLGRLVERALEKQLNTRLSLIDGLLETTKKRARLSVARLRFALDAAHPELAEQAIAQALRGDVRLAQALANRGEPGFTATFDLSRSGVASTSYAGIDIFSMSFFSKTVETAGSVVAQTPGGARTLLFESLHKEAGWFFSSHGHTRVSLSGLVYDPTSASALPSGEANLVVQIQEGDDYMERDKLLDHLDGVILGLGGPAALSAIEIHGNALEGFVEAYCANSAAFDPCRTDVLSHPKVVALRADGATALAAKLAHLEPKQRDLVMECGKLRLTAQATYEPKASLVGPDTSVVVDYRLDDAALEYLMVEQNKYTMRTALERYLGAVLTDRDTTAEQLAAERSSIAGNSKINKTIGAMAERYESHANTYRRLLAAEDAVIDTLGQVGPRAIEVRYQVAEDNRPDYASATASSLSQARARQITQLYDGLYKLAKSLAPHAEQPVAYSLLSLTPPALVDLRIDVRMDLDDHWGQNFKHYRQAGYAPFDAYAKGTSVAAIDGGLFDVKALLDVQ
jgi:hypothetical protein